MGAIQLLGWHERSGGAPEERFVGNALRPTHCPVRGEGRYVFGAGAPREIAHLAKVSPTRTPFNILRHALWHPSQRSHKLLCDDSACGTLPVDDSARHPVSHTLGRHAMSDGKTPTRFAKGLLRAAPLETSAVKSPATEPRNAEGLRSRHAAITNNFNSWRSYKEWAEKIRGTWEGNK